MYEKKVIQHVHIVMGHIPLRKAPEEELIDLNAHYVINGSLLTIERNYHHFGYHISMAYHLEN